MKSTARFSVDPRLLRSARRDLRLQRTNSLTESDICLDLACALLARGQVSKLVAARVAGVELFEFDSELERRNIPSCTAESLAEDMDSIRTLFQR